MFTYHEKVSCSTKEPLEASWVIRRIYHMTYHMIYCKKYKM
jgi:hypothetical protein